MKTVAYTKPKGCYWTVALLQAFIVYCMLLPLSDAFASATVGSVINSGVRNYNTMPKLLTYVATVAGFIVIVTGIHKLRLHVDRPDQVPVSHGLWHLLGGTFLVSVPAAWSIFVNSFKLAVASGATTSATNIALSASSSDPLSLDVMMIRLVQNIRGPIQFAIWTLAAVLGLFFLITAFLRMARGAAQDGPRGSLGSGTMMRIFIGSVLLSFAATADVFTTTLFAGSVVKFNGMEISGVSASSLEHVNKSVSAILVFVQIIGFIAFMRGFLMLRALADGNNGISTAAAFTHIIGGAVAINISPMLLALQNTVCGSGASCSVFNFT